MMKPPSLKICIPLVLFILYFSCSGPDNESTSESDPWKKEDPVPEAVIMSTRLFRERLLEDPYRPAYHFCIPEDNGVPGDPNGAFYYKGRYHLMYLYHREGTGFSYGHLSSSDLLHWRHHPDAIGPGGGDHGIFSGGGFVDKNGRAVITYWEFMNDQTREAHEEGRYTGRPFGVGIATSDREPFDTWEKSPANPVIPSTHWGITVTEDQNGEQLIYGSADPSQIWENDGRYYMLTGNLLVLRKYGIGPDALHDSISYQGDHLYLFASDDLLNWEYQHEFYTSDRKWTDKTEDNMCPSFLPLPSSPKGGEPSGKHLLLFISHNKGCQYYVGSYRNNRFYPDNHGRMTWEDNAYFAPEALIDGRGRQIMWAWIFDDRPDKMKETSGWSGTYGLPRSLWLGEDGTLRMRPVEELKQLRMKEKEKRSFTIPADGEITLEGFDKELMELELIMQPGEARQAGVMVACSEDGTEKTLLYYDASEHQLVCDASRSSLEAGRRITERGPFSLKDGEPLVLRVFMDRSIVEVYANDRQAIARRIYPTLGQNRVKLFSRGGPVEVTSAKCWEMMPSNPY